MPLQLTIVTEEDILKYERNELDAEGSRGVEEALKIDERARAVLRRIRSEATQRSRQKMTWETKMTSDLMNATTKVSQLQTGIDKRSELAESLTGCLADTYVLMLKSQGYHWNVVGPLFKSLHELTEEHYQNLFEAGDVIAERIRALGYPAPYSFAQMIQASQIPEEDGTPDTAAMLRALISGHEATARRFREAAAEAEEHQDIVTADLLTERIAFHEKAIWMFKSIAA